MADVTSTISSRELREQLSDVIARVSYGGERVGVTKNGKLAAIILSVEDVEALEAFEEAQDLAAYREAKAEDDGERIALDDLRASFHR